MKSKSVYQLQRTRQNLLQQLQQLSLDYHHHYQNFQQLGEPHQQDLQEDIAQMESNLQNTKQHLQQMYHGCQKAMSDKKVKIAQIQEYQMKQNKMNSILKEQQSKLNDVQQESQEVEQAIKKSRDYYEQLQEEIHSLDAKTQNLKNYGFQDVSESTMKQFQEHQSLQRQNIILQEKIANQKKNLSQMVSRQEIRAIQRRIKELRNKQQEMEELKEQNNRLAAENQKLNETKSQYEWNPNLQIKGLESNLSEQQEKIALLEKEISAINKKSTECSSKIANYHSYLQHSNISQAEKNKKGKCKMTIYDEIRQQIVKETVNEIEQDQNTKRKEKQQDGRTYKLKRKVQLVQFCMVVAMLMGLVYWCHRMYKK